MIKHYFEFNNYDAALENMIMFPTTLFIILIALITIYLVKLKKLSYFYSFLIGIYIAYLICTLFFPIVTYWGDGYNFINETGTMILAWHPYARILNHPVYSTFHLLMFIPLGYLIRKNKSLKVTIFIVIAIAFGIENLQIIINFLCHYVQYTYDLCDILFHLISFSIGIGISYLPIKKHVTNN